MSSSGDQLQRRSTDALGDNIVVTDPQMTTRDRALNVYAHGIEFMVLLGGIVISALTNFRPDVLEATSLLTVAPSTVWVWAVLYGVGGVLGILGLWTSRKAQWRGRTIDGLRIEAVGLIFVTTALLANTLAGIDRLGLSSGSLSNIAILLGCWLRVVTCLVARPIAVPVEVPRMGGR